MHYCSCCEGRTHRTQIPPPSCVPLCTWYATHLKHARSKQTYTQTYFSEYTHTHMKLPCAHNQIQPPTTPQHQVEAELLHEAPQPPHILISCISRSVANWFAYVVDRFGLAIQCFHLVVVLSWWVACLCDMLYWLWFGFGVLSVRGCGEGGMSMI